MAATATVVAAVAAVAAVAVAAVVAVVAAVVAAAVAAVAAAVATTAPTTRYQGGYPAACTVTGSRSVARRLQRTPPASAVCPSPAAQIYLVALGGNPGLDSGTNNAALDFMLALGPYSAITLSTKVNITELTTVAAVYPLTQMLGFGASGELHARLAAANLSAKSPWLDQAVARANGLVSAADSAPGPGLPAPASCTGNSSDPVNCGAEEKLNSLANALAACARTSAPASSACAQLFCVATPGATFNGSACSPPAGGAIPMDTLQAALAITLNPGTVAVSGIFSLAAAAPLHAPMLGRSPTDWTLALNFVGGGLDNPLGIAVDGVGNIWIANNSPGAASVNSVTELSNSGVPRSPATGFTGGGLNQPGSVAIDSTGNVWITNFGGGFGNSVTKLSSVGMPLSPSGGFTGGGLGDPINIAVDVGDNIWITNQRTVDNDGNNLANYSFAKLSSSGAPLSPPSGYTGGGLFQPYGIAVDAAGNVWAPNTGTSSVSKFSNSGLALSPAAGYTGGGLSSPTNIAIDSSGNVWIRNSGIQGVSELSNSGAILSPSSGFSGGGLNGNAAIAIDGNDNVWLANNIVLSGSVTELSRGGVPLSPSTGFTGGGLNEPIGIAIDSAGNVWMTNYYCCGAGASSVTEIIGAAVPVKTPLIGPPRSP